MGRAEPATAPVPEAEAHPLGIARGQIARTYIVAEAEDGLVIVDQHAAHERLVLEQLRHGMAGQAVPSQGLLLPEVVELDEPACDRLEAAAPQLAALGVELERFGPAAVFAAGYSGPSQSRPSGVSCRRISRRSQRCTHNPSFVVATSRVPSALNVTV